MPKYKLPQKKEGKEEKGNSLEAVEMDDMWRRMITVPANKDIIKEAKVGDEVKITLVGTVTEVASRESRDSSEDSRVEIEVQEVEFYKEGDFEKYAEDEDDDGETEEGED